MLANTMKQDTEGKHWKIMPSTRKNDEAYKTFDLDDIVAFQILTIDFSK